MPPPVLNIVERIVKMDAPQAAGLGVDHAATMIKRVAALLPHSVATVLPRANWSTVYDRWVAWTVGNAQNPGYRVDPSGAIKAALDVCEAWQNVTLTKDCLYLNVNLVAKLERLVGSMREQLAGSAADSVPTIVSNNCMAHTSVLGLKPIFRRIPGLTSFLVRVGHLCRSSRAAVLYEVALLKEFDLTF